MTKIVEEKEISRVTEIAKEKLRWSGIASDRDSERETKTQLSRKKSNY